MNNAPPFSTLTTSPTVRSNPVDETTDILLTAQHIDKEVTEAKRLRQIKDTLLNAHERSWVDNVIAEVQDAVEAVVLILDPSGVGLDPAAGILEGGRSKGKLGVGRKMLWKLRDQQKLKGKYQRLVVTHQSLTTVMSFLHGRVQTPVDSGGYSGATWSQPALGAAGGPPSYELSQMLDWRQRKQQSRMKPTNTAYGNGANSHSPLDPIARYPGQGKERLAELE